MFVQLLFELTHGLEGTHEKLPLLATCLREEGRDPLRGVSCHHFQRSGVEMI
jgi:hypothetical protein